VRLTSVAEIFYFCSVGVELKLEASLELREEVLGVC
jgi:hypothetical protein